MVPIESSSPVFSGPVPSIYALKSRFQGLLRPAVKRLHAMGVTANQVTLAAMAVSLLVAVVVFLFAARDPRWFALLPAWMFLRMALNAVDGMLAREFGQQSRLGAYLNELCDIAADAALYLSLLAVPGIAPWTPWAFAWLAAFAEYAGVMAPLAGAARRYDGPMGKSDRALVVGALGLALSLQWVGGDVATWVLSVAAALCVPTAIHRVKKGLAS